MVRDARVDHYKAVSKMGLWKNPIGSLGHRGVGGGVGGGCESKIEMFVPARLEACHVIVTSPTWSEQTVQQACFSLLSSLN